MALEATLSKTWRNRQLLISLFLTGFGLWFFYDGLIVWPNKNKAYAAYEQLKSEGREGEWPEYTRERGWERIPPKHPYEPEQISQQFILGSLALAGALFALGLLAVNSRRTLRSDEEAVYGETGKRVPLDAITDVNRKKWDSKGIAVALYEQGGRRRKLVIDDYKFTGGERILKQVEEHLTARNTG
jgi:hypothetical protein